jgi:hypothetical protein
MTPDAPIYDRATIHAAWDDDEQRHQRYAAAVHADVNLMRVEAVKRVADSEIAVWKDRAYNAEADVDALTDELALVRDTLALRSHALNVTGERAQTAEATIARVRALIPHLWVADLTLVAQRFEAALDGEKR